MGSPNLSGGLFCSQNFRQDSGNNLDMKGGTRKITDRSITIIPLESSPGIGIIDRFLFLEFNINSDALVGGASCKAE
jgi:hypothetical protein